MRLADAHPASLGPTAETLRLWTQIAGKVAVARSPWLNHSWHLTLRVSARGAVPALQGRVARSGALTLPPASYAFAVVPAARAAGCQGQPKRS